MTFEQKLVEEINDLKFQRRQLIEENDKLRKALGYYASHRITRDLKSTYHNEDRAIACEALGLEHA